MKPIIAFILSICAVQAAAPPAAFTRQVRLSGETVTVNYVLHPIRSPNFSVWAQDSEGALVPHTPGASRIYLGTVEGHPGAIACALLREDDSFLGRISFENGVEWITRNTTTTVRGSSDWAPGWPGVVPASGGAGGKVYAAEVGVDATPQEYAAAGSDVERTLQVVEFSMMAVNQIYIRDAGIIHRLGRLIVRTSSTHDPYAADTTTSMMLGTVRNQWNNVLPQGTHDVALAVRSANLGGNGFQSNIGTSYAYSGNSADSYGDFSQVWRHEVGHNWGANHQEGGTPEGPTLMSTNTLSKLSGSELAKVLAYKQTRLGVLDDLGAYPFPIPPHAALDRVTVTPRGGAVAIDVLANDHDANGESLALVAFDQTTASGSSITLSRGTGAGGRNQLSFTPAAGFLTGLDHFTYRIQDSSGRQAVGNVMVRPYLEEAMICHWPFNEASGTLAKDVTLGANNGTLTGGPTRVASGRSGGSLSFDGTDDHVIFPSIPVQANRLTLCGWVKRNGSQPSFAGIGFNRGPNPFGFNFGNANELRFHWESGSNPSYSFNSGLVPPDGVWAFCALVVEPARATIYLSEGDSVQQASTTGTFGQINLGNEPFYLATDPATSSRYFKGELDDFRLYRRALSLAEITSLARGGGSVTAPVPAVGATGTPAALGDLAWSAPSSATTFDVFLGTSLQGVAAATTASSEFLGNTSSPGFAMPALSDGTYFWRVDAAGGTVTFPGPVWYFTVAGANRSPAFVTNPVDALNAIEGHPYTGRSLAGLATDSDAADALTFSKLAGPEWLTIAPDGSLAGTPPAGSAGVHEFQIKVADSYGGSDNAVLKLTVEVPATFEARLANLGREGGKVSAMISWGAIPGQAYQIEWSTDLESWTACSAVLSPVTTAGTAISDPVPETSAVFFRIRSLP